MAPLILNLSDIHWVGWESSREICKCLEKIKSCGPAGDGPAGCPAINPTPPKALGPNNTI